MQIKTISVVNHKNKMCGDLPAGHKKHTITVVLDKDENYKQVTLYGDLMNARVKEVWLDEYMIEMPNGGAVNPSVWLFDVDSDPFEKTAKSGGTALAITGATISYVNYNSVPRVLSMQTKAGKTQFSINLRNYADGTAVTFERAFFRLSFIYEIPNWSPTYVMRDTFTRPFTLPGDANNPASLPPSGTMPVMTGLENRKF